MQRSLAFFSSVLVTAASGLAQAPVDTSASKTSSLDAAYRGYVDARDKLQPEMSELRSSISQAEGEERQALIAKYGELSSKIRDAHQAFEKAFAAADWASLDPQANADILKEGLPTIAYETGKDAEKALQASRLYLEHFPDGPSAAGIRGRALPYALLASGKPDDAIDAMHAAMEGADEMAKARYLMTLGDIHAAVGEMPEAKAAYEKARDASGSVASDVDQRLALLGKPAPDIDSETWIGGEAKALRELQGNVVLVDFWATWCGPCRMVMPSLDGLYREHGKDGLVVMGVTKYYDHGYMPANAEQMNSGGASVDGLTEDTFPAHVTTFRDHTGISYPFVLGTKEDFESYGVRGIPTLAVIGKDGNVALVAVGSGSEPLIAAAVERLLKS